MARGKRFGVVAVGLVLGAALSRPAVAQMRGQVPPPRRIHPRVHHAAHASPPAVAHRGPWTAAHASFILSAESLFGFGYSRQVATETTLGQTQEAVQSATTVHLFKGSEIVSPFSTSRLAFDGVLGPGVTLGASFGFANTSMTTRSDGQSEDTEVRTWIFVPRVGYLLAPSRYLGVWLRAGVGFVDVRFKTEGTEASSSSFDLVLDPMLVITPMPHAGILIGPSLNIPTSGSNTTTGSTGLSREIDNRFAYYGLSAGIALLF
jgi:hypothetical protein